MSHIIQNNRTTGKFEKIATCESCQLLKINRVICHETGCPEAWRDEEAECRECGDGFEREEKHKDFCSEHCRTIYWGNECYCSACEDDRRTEEIYYGLEEID